MSNLKQPARTHNQNHVPRKYTPGGRRISIYWTWSYPWEANRDVTELDNRFSTWTEVRRVAWPNFLNLPSCGCPVPSRFLRKCGY